VGAAPAPAAARTSSRSSADGGQAPRPVRAGRRGNGSPVPQEAQDQDQALKKRSVTGVAALLSTSEIREAILGYQQEAAEQDKALGARDFRSLRVMLGEALQAMNIKDPSGNWIANLAREWDPNRDGAITKMEFRQDIRNTVPDTERDKSEVTVVQIDALFDELDLNHSGELDMKEVMLAVKSLQVDAAKAEKARQGVRDKMAALNERTKAAEEVYELTKVYEEAEQAMRVAEKGSIGAQVGTLLKSKNFKVNDIVAKWSADASQISQAKFRQGILSLGVDAPHSELNLLFDSLVKGQEGVLSTEELRDALKIMVEACAGIKESIKHLKAELVAQEKAIRAVQAVFLQQREDEERAAAEAAEKLAAAEADAALAAERRKLQRKAELDAKQKAKAEQEAAFKARIDAKRGSASAAPAAAEAAIASPLPGTQVMELHSQGA
jgi:Ca2+-binding EF-hand superfamily protein